MKAPVKNVTPVWVIGTLLKETKRDTTIRVVDKRGKKRDVTLPALHRLQYDGSYGFLVPAFWAHKQKLEPASILKDWKPLTNEGEQK